MDKNNIYLSKVITDQELSRIQPGEFNIIKAPCGYGKTTFMFDERILNFSRAKKHVLYLIQNKNTRDMIAQLHADKARVFNDGNGNGWFTHRRGGVWTAEDDEDFVHVMCYQTFSALLRNEGTDWLGDIDLIVWDEFDDIKSYYESEVRKIGRVLPDFSREELVALLQNGNTRSVVNFVYQIKNLILDPARIRLIVVSATPECAAYYFQDYINYIITGNLELKYNALHTEFINDVIAAIYDGILVPDGRRFWCYTKFIGDALRIETAARSVGFNPLSTWSEANPNYTGLFTDEKRRAIAAIRDRGQVPEGYDFIITTGVLGRGINVYDTSFQDWICNSTDYEDIHQYMRARFSPERQYLLEGARGLVQFVQDGFPIEYSSWHTIAEVKELLARLPIFTSGVEPKRITTAVALKKAYPDQVETRRYGAAHTVQYRIKSKDEV